MVILEKSPMVCDLYISSQNYFIKHFTATSESSVNAFHKSHIGYSLRMRLVN